MRESRKVNVSILKCNSLTSALFRDEPYRFFRIFKGSFGKCICQRIRNGNALPSGCPVDKVLLGMHHVYQVDDSLRCHVSDWYLYLCFCFFRLWFLCFFCNIVLKKHPSHLIFHTVIFKDDLCVPVHRDAADAVCKTWWSKVL